MLVHERRDRVLLIDWSVKYKQCEVVGFAPVDSYYSQINHTITVEIAAYDVWMIFRSGFPSSPVSRRTDGAQILVACAVSVASKSVTWMDFEPCGHRTVLACIEALASRRGRNAEQQECDDGGPDLEIH
jgi:hypothetical protein